MFDKFPSFRTAPPSGTNDRLSSALPWVGAVLIAFAIVGCMLFTPGCHKKGEDKNTTNATNATDGAKPDCKDCKDGKCKTQTPPAKPAPAGEVAPLPPPEKKATQASPKIDLEAILAQEREFNRPDVTVTISEGDPITQRRVTLVDLDARIVVTADFSATKGDRAATIFAAADFVQEVAKLDLPDRAKIKAKVDESTLVEVSVPPGGTARSRMKALLASAAKYLEDAARKAKDENNPAVNAAFLRPKVRST